MPIPNLMPETCFNQVGTGAKETVGKLCSTCLERSTGILSPLLFGAGQVVFSGFNRAAKQLLEMRPLKQ